MVPEKVLTYIAKHYPELIILIVALITIAVAGYEYSQTGCLYHGRTLGKNGRMAVHPGLCGDGARVGLGLLGFMLAYSIYLLVTNDRSNS